MSEWRRWFLIVQKEMLVTSVPRLGHFVPPRTPPAIGPGTYNPAHIRSATRGAASAFKKAPCSDDSLRTATPGPGAYARPSSAACLGRPSPLERPLLRQRSRVVWSRRSSAPSIPIPGDAHGYEEDDDGNLITQAPAADRAGDVEPPTRTGVGPGSYNPNSRLMVRTSISFSIPRAAEQLRFEGGPPASTNAPGSHWGISRNPHPRYPPPSAVFCQPSAGCGQGRTTRRPNRTAWRGRCVFGVMRDPQRRPYESSTTGLGDVRPSVAPPPGPGTHGTLPCWAKPITSLPRQIPFQSAHLGALGSCACTPIGVSVCGALAPTTK